jgi:hypothetical protein
MRWGRKRADEYRRQAGEPPPQHKHESDERKESRGQEPRERGPLVRGPESFRHHDDLRRIRILRGVPLPAVDEPKKHNGYHAQDHQRRPHDDKTGNRESQGSTPSGLPYRFLPKALTPWPAMTGHGRSNRHGSRSFTTDA